MSEDDEAAAGAGDAAGAEAGAAGAESDDDEFVPVLLPESEDFGLALPYPSAYHPPPLNETAGAERTRSR